MRRALLLIGLVVLGLAMLVAAGCGGGGSRLSKEDYASKSDVICKDANDAVSKLGNPQGFGQLEEFAGKVIPILEDGLGKLKKLKPPKDAEATSKAWLATGDNALGYLKELKDAAKAKDTAKIQQIGREAQANDTKGNALARSMGMTDCATSS